MSAWCSTCGVSTKIKPMCSGSVGVGHAAGRRARRRVAGLPARTGIKHRDKCEECRSSEHIDPRTGLCRRCSR